MSGGHWDNQQLQLGRMAGLLEDEDAPALRQASDHLEKLMNLLDQIDAIYSFDSPAEPLDGLLREVEEITGSIKPIDTAPKTGERILLWGDERLKGCEVAAEDWDPAWSIGYWVDDFWSNDTDGEIIRPTHWKPLPGKPV